MLPEQGMKIDIAYAVSIGQHEGLVLDIWADPPMRPPVCVFKPVSTTVTFHGSRDVVVHNHFITAEKSNVTSERCR